MARSSRRTPRSRELEIVSLLFGGNTANADARDAELRTLQKDSTQRDLATSRLQQAALGVVSAPLTRAVEQAFALDTVQITPNLTFDPNQRLNPTARLTVGKRISDKVFLTFSRSLTSAGGGTQVDPARVQPERPPVLDRLAERGRHLRDRRPREARVLMRSRVLPPRRFPRRPRGAARRGAVGGHAPSWASSSASRSPRSAWSSTARGEGRGGRARDRDRGGWPLTTAAVRQSIVRLMAIARFDDVTVEAEMSASGVVLTYVLAPAHPVKVIRFQGDLGLPENQLRTAVTERYTASPPLSRVEEIADMLEAALPRPRVPEGDGAAGDGGDPQSGRDDADLRNGCGSAGAVVRGGNRRGAGGKRRARCVRSSASRPAPASIASRSTRRSRDTCQRCARPASWRPGSRRTSSTPRARSRST